MKLLDRSVLKEMVVPFLIGQAAIVMLLTGTVLYNNANVLLMNQVPLTFVVRMALYFLPFLIHMTMPVAMAVGASLAVTRLGRDSEITALRAAGVSLRRIFLPIYALGLCVSATDFWFGEYVVPLSVNKLEVVMAEMPTHLRRMVPQSGKFIIASDQSYAIYAQSILPEKGYIALHGVVIVATPRISFSREKAPLMMTAERGRYRDGRWILEKPTLIHAEIDGRKRLESRPERFELYTAVDPQAFKADFMIQFPMWQMGERSADTTFHALGERLAANRKAGIQDHYALLDYHFKLSVPFSCLVMALCCPPLALRFAKGGGFTGTLLSICLVFVYWNTMLLMRILGSPGPDGSAPALAPPVAAWFQNVVFTLIGLIALRRSE